MSASLKPSLIATPQSVDCRPLLVRLTNAAAQTAYISRLNVPRGVNDYCVPSQQRAGVRQAAHVRPSVCDICPMQQILNSCFQKEREHAPNLTRLAIRFQHVFPYTFLDVCEKKIHQFLSSIKKDAHKRKLVPFLCLTV